MDTQVQKPETWRQPWFSHPLGFTSNSSANPVISTSYFKSFSPFLPPLPPSLESLISLFPRLPPSIYSTHTIAGVILTHKSDQPFSCLKPFWWLLIVLEWNPDPLSHLDRKPSSVCCPLGWTPAATRVPTFYQAQSCPRPLLGLFPLTGTHSLHFPLASSHPLGLTLTSISEKSSLPGYSNHCTHWPTLVWFPIYCPFLPVNHKLGEGRDSACFVPCSLLIT